MGRRYARSGSRGGVSGVHSWHGAALTRHEPGRRRGGSLRAQTPSTKVRKEQTEGTESRIARAVPGARRGRKRTVQRDESCLASHSATRRIRIENTSTGIMLSASRGAPMRPRSVGWRWAGNAGVFHGPRVSLWACELVEETRLQSQLLNPAASGLWATTKGLRFVPSSVTPLLSRVTGSPS